MGEYIKEFCRSSGKYTYYENYSGRMMFNRKCSGVVVPQGESAYTMISELMMFLVNMGIVDSEFHLGTIASDDLGLDTIIYFPDIK